MIGNKGQLQRLLFIDRMIREGMQSGRLANCSTIAGAYEVSSKSIMRDIDYLKNQGGAPIEYVRHRHGFCYTEESYRLPAMQISESDLFAIALARKTMKQYENTPLYQKLSMVFKKIEDSLPDRVSVDPTWIDERMSVAPESRTAIASSVWEDVAAGLRQCRRLEFDYLKPGAESVESRLVDPYHTVNFQGEWYLIGHCHQRRKIRTFALSRIHATRITTKIFTRPADFSFEQFFGHQVGIFQGTREVLVRLLFSAQQRPYIEEREWYRDQQLERREDGSVLLSFTTRHLFEVKRWVLSWGGEVKVLAPLELADNLRQELRKALQAYE